MLLVLLCCTLLGFAEEKPIKLEEKKRPDPRSLVQLPTAFIEDSLLTIEFPSSTTFSVLIVNNAGEEVYFNNYCSEITFLTLSHLSMGEYTLVIKDGSYTYSGEFNIE